MHATRGSSTTKDVQILYRNYRGEVAVRHIVPIRVWYGPTDWHPEPQWLLDAIDVDKGAERSFALRDILDFDHAGAGPDVSY